VRVDGALNPSEQAALDRLELELRKLPEVLAVGFEGPGEGTAISDDAVITVHVFVTEDARRAQVEQQALDLGRLHVDRPLRVQLAPETDEEAPTVKTSRVATHRVKLVHVDLTDDGSNVEVTIERGDARVVASGPSGLLSGSVDATIAALSELGWSVPFGVSSCVRLSVGGSADAVMVRLAGGGGERLGVATGSTPQQAAVKATLQALNRWLDDPARRSPAGAHPPTPRP
jgi:hypothetical protein